MIYKKTQKTFLLEDCRFKRIEELRMKRCGLIENLFFKPLY